MTSPRQHRSFRPALELLEDRRLPSGLAHADHERGDDHSDREITVMTRNLYVGTELDSAIGALASGDPNAIVAAISQAWANVAATNFTGVTRSAWLYGGVGDDELRGGSGADQLLGEDGNDMLRGRDGNDQLDGGGGDDDLHGGDGNDLLLSGAGNDTLDAGEGADVLQGGAGDDLLIGRSGADVLDGGAGNDELRGGGEGDALSGGTGNDILKGGSGRDFLDGGAGNDSLNGGAGDDILLGGEGDDLIVGGGGRDLLIGGLGSDRIVGNGDDDILISGTTRFDADQAALDAILAEWASGASYAVRTGHLMGPTAGLNTVGGQAIFLKAGPTPEEATVFDDGAEDVLTGDGGHDWFWANISGGGVQDRITDLGAQEFANDLIFINS